MSLLIVKSSVKDQNTVDHVIRELTEKVPKSRVIDTVSLTINPCRGCCGCMLQTPGECCLDDDYEEVLKAYLEYDHIVFIVDTALGFINHTAKNLIDRIFPLVHVLTHFRDGEILHIPRYERDFKLALLYTGDAERELIEEWIIRFEKNMGGHSLGAFPINDMEELYRCIS